MTHWCPTPKLLHRKAPAPKRYTPGQTNRRTRNRLDRGADGDRATARWSRSPPPAHQVLRAPQPSPVVAPLPPTVTVTAQPQSLPEFSPLPGAYQRWVSLLNSRGLWIAPGHQSDNDQHIRSLCTALATDDNPTWRANTIQTAIQETEQSSPNWGPPEASYAIHAALQAYCSQFNR